MKFIDALTDAIGSMLRQENKLARIHERDMRGAQDRIQQLEDQLASSNRYGERQRKTAEELMHTLVCVVHRAGGTVCVPQSSFDARDAIRISMTKRYDDNCKWWVFETIDKSVLADAMKRAEAKMPKKSPHTRTCESGDYGGKCNCGAVVPATPMPAGAVDSQS